MNERFQRWFSKFKDGELNRISKDPIGAFRSIQKFIKIFCIYFYVYFFHNRSWSIYWISWLKKTGFPFKQFNSISNSSIIWSTAKSNTTSIWVPHKEAVLSAIAAFFLHRNMKHCCTKLYWRWKLDEQNSKYKRQS